MTTFSLERLGLNTRGCANRSSAVPGATVSDMRVDTVEKARVSRLTAMMLAETLEARTLVSDHSLLVRDILYAAPVTDFDISQ